ncbi:hypothetical protein [Parendozoicomonas sp. Alg238-R29]|uniref:hypothetical protein n=1 Tax=Parendozoicomonas sp. Alg238-R29 TaxID=2993446 RepID=UPI00248E6961|nr:hypothetical protein [Parendozoicomonas sp. Alg238-R29]
MPTMRTGDVLPTGPKPVLSPNLPELENRPLQQEPATSSVEGTKHLPEPLPDENDAEVSSPLPDKTRELLNYTSGGRFVRLHSDEPDPDEVNETQRTPPSLSQRTVKEQEPRGWLDTLLPWRWGTKKTSERVVTKPVRSGITNWSIFYLIKKFVDRYIKGFSTSDLTGSLQKLSSCYHHSKNGSAGEPQTIFLKRLYLPGPNITLQDVTVKLHHLEPVGKGEGADQFKQIDIKADVSGKAIVWLDETKSQEATLDIKDVDLSAHFKNGTMIKSLLDKGTLYGNLTLAFYNRNRLKDCLIPSHCVCHLNEGASVSIRTPGYHDATSGVKIESADLLLDFDPQSDRQGKNPTFGACVANLDARVHSSKMDLIVPDTIKPLMKQLFPHALLGKTEVQVKTAALDINKYEDGTLRAESDYLQVHSEGDLNLNDGEITGLTLVKKKLSEDESTTAVLCQDFSGDLYIPQATFNMPYDINGSVQLKDSSVLLNTRHISETSKKLETVDFSVGSGHANLSGGISCKNFAMKGLTGSFVVDSSETALKIEHAQVDTVSIGTAPDKVTSENRLLEAGVTLENTQIYVTPDQETQTMVTTVDVDRLHGRDINGIAEAHTADLENLNVLFQTGTPVPLHPEQVDPSAPIHHPKLKVKAKNLSAERVLVPDNVLGQSIKAELNSRTVKNLSIECTLPSSLTTQEDQDDFRKSLSREIEPWQLPQTCVASVHTTIKTDQIDSQVDLALPGANDSLKDNSVWKTKEEDRYTPRSKGTITTGPSELEFQYDMRNGFDQATFKSKKHVTIDLQHGDLQGKIETTGFETLVKGGSIDSPDEVTTDAQCDHLACTGFKVSERFLPKDVEIEADVELTSPAIYIKTQPPEKQYNKETEEVVSSSRPVQSTLEVSQSKFKTHIKGKKKSLASPKTAKKLKALTDYFPEQYQESARPLLKHLDTIEEDSYESDTLEQDVTFQSENIKIQADVKKNNDKEIEVTTNYSELSLPSGAVIAKAHITDLNAHASKTTGHTDLQLQLSETAIDYAGTSDEYKLPVQAELKEPAKLQGIKVSVSQNGDETLGHGEIEQGEADFTLGLDSTIKDPATHIARRMKPAHIKADLRKLQVNAQKDKHLALANTSVAAVKLNISDTQDQIGTDLNVNTELRDALVVADSAGTGSYLDVELGRAELNVSGSLNGSFQAQNVGVSACRDLEGTKVNPRIDARRVKTNFPNASRELVNIFRSTRLQKSALGQIADLKVSPDLDENMSGTLTLSAGGALSPFIALGLSYAGGKVARGFLRIAKIIVKVLRVHIYLDHLPIHEGKATLPDLQSCLRISFSSDHGRGGRIYAKSFGKAIDLVQGLFVKKALKYIHLLDNKTGEISFTNLASHLGENVQLVSKDRMPNALLPSTGDALTDTKNLLQLNKSLPPNWTKELHLKALQQRIENLHWRNKPLKNHPWADTSWLANKIVQDYGFPQTLLEFHCAEDLLMTFQQKLRELKQPTSLPEVYKQAVLKVPAIPMDTLQESTPAPFSPQAKVVPTNQREKEYRHLEAKIVAKDMERIPQELLRWISERAEEETTRPENVFQRAQKATRTLIRSTTWKKAATLSQELQSPLPLIEKNQKMQDLWHTCRALNAKIQAVCSPISPIAAGKFVIGAGKQDEPPPLQTPPHSTFGQ